MADQYIVVLHYKTIEQTRMCVESIRAHTPNYRVLIIDNHSNDGSARLLDKEYELDSSVEVIPLDKNEGYARANDFALDLLAERGIERAILTNNDIVFKSNVSKCLFAELEASGDTLVAVPRVLGLDGKVQDSVQIAARSKMRWVMETIAPSMVSRTDNSLLSGITEIQEFSGCCVACNVELMLRIGAFDKKTFLYFEEPILAAKARANHLRMIYVPDAIVIHHHGASTSGLSELSNFYLLESETYYLKKYLKVSNFILFAYLVAKRASHRRRYGLGPLYTMETQLIARVWDGSLEES